ncbi:hypothetical protein NC651_037582 [Populus alba x Populus x berolinensis]|nr:hypothetical protein NC651_037582 [Populus alba x Populus x berolinensis]
MEVLLNAKAASSIPEYDDSNYNRAKEFKAFEETKAGVKGLVDSGVTKIPGFFVYAPENVQKSSAKASNISIQVTKIDFEGFKNSLRTEVLMNQWIHDPPLCTELLL